jgi:hypothetical protein
MSLVKSPSSAKNSTKIFQFRPDTWQLLESDTTGLRRKMTSYADKYMQY